MINQNIQRPVTAATVTGWLLDIHTLLWMLHGDKRLSKPAAQAIDGKP